MKIVSCHQMNCWPVSIDSAGIAETRPADEIQLAATATVSAAFPARPSPSRIRQAWLDEWRRRWPRWGDTASLENLAGLFEAAMNQPAVTGRPELLLRLHRLFRRSVLRPVAAFVYIAFAALELERLRAGLLRHAMVREGIVAS